jgi:hypothetical protein
MSPGSVSPVLAGGQCRQGQAEGERSKHVLAALALLADTTGCPGQPGRVCKYHTVYAEGAEPRSDSAGGIHVREKLLLQIRVVLHHLQYFVVPLRIDSFLFYDTYFLRFCLR